MDTGFKSHSETSTDPANEPDEQTDLASKVPDKQPSIKPLSPAEQDLEKSFKAPSATAANRPAPKSSDAAPKPTSSSSGGDGRNFGARSFDFASKHRKKLFAGGGIAGIVLSLALGFFALLPFKLESIMKNLMTHETARAKTYVDRRVDAIMFRYLYEQATGTLSSDGFFVGKGIIRTVYGNWRINKFEDKLKAEKGISIEKVGNHGVRFTLADGTKFTAANEPDLMKHLNADLKGSQARAALKDFARSTYSDWWRVLQRRQIRKYMQNAFNIRRWGIKKQEDTTDPKKPDVVGSTIEDIQAGEITPAEDLSMSTLDCALSSGPCPNADERINADGTSEARPPLTTPEQSDPAIAAEEAKAADTTKQGIRDGYDAMKKASTKVLADALEKIIGKTTTKLIFESVPVVGWLALAADFDHFFWSGAIRDIGIALHSAQYAGVAATWASLADQMKAGDLAASQINILMIMLNDVEKSNAVQRIVLQNPTGGTPLPHDKRVGSDTSAQNDTVGDGSLCNVGYGFIHIKDTPPTSDLGSADFWTFIYRQVSTGPLPPGFHPPLCALRGVADLLSKLVQFAVGDIFSKLFNLIIDAINFAISTAVGHTIDIMALAQQGIAWAIGHIWTPVVTGREVGAALGNAIDAGWDVTANQMCRDVLGCQNIPYKVSFAQDTQIAAQNRAILSHQSVIANLLNTDYPESLGSQMLALVPGTPAGVIGRVGSTGLAMIANPFRYLGSIFASFFPYAHAAVVPNIEPNGVQQTGYVESQLADPNLHLATTDIAGPPGTDGALTGPDGRIDQYDCPQETNPSLPNQCLLDTAAAQALCSVTTTDDDGGLGGNGDPGDCGDVASAPADATAGTPPSGSGTPPTGNIQSLAQQILNNKNITFWTNNGVNTRDVFVALSKGLSAYTTCPNANGAKPAVNPNILRFILAAAARTHLMVNALTDKCHTAGSNHYSGEAVDLDLNSGPLSILNPIALQFGGLKNSEITHYHYDFPK